jgi:hypothetical protein
MKAFECQTVSCWPESTTSIPPGKCLGPGPNKDGSKEPGATTLHVGLESTVTMDIRLRRISFVLSDAHILIAEVNILEGINLCHSLYY